MALRLDPEIGRPLNTFKNSRELVTVMSDVMKGQYSSVVSSVQRKTNGGYRDISAKNIFITSSGRGVLVDSDICHGSDENQMTVKTIQNPRRESRQFVSAAILMDPEHCQDHIDDQESAFYILVYFLLLYTKHNQQHNLRYYMDGFEGTSDSNRTKGICKFVLLRTGALNDDLVFTDHPLLTEIIRELATLFSVRYESPPDKILLAFYESEAGAKFSENPITRRRNLDQWLWLETLQEYLKDTSQWPDNDAASRNPICSSKHRS